MWTQPQATEMRFGFEVNYVRNEQVIDHLYRNYSLAAS